MLVRVASLKSPEQFRAHCQSLDIEIPCDDSILTGANSPLTQPLSNWNIRGKTPSNRWVIHPMEGWDGTTTGGTTDEVRRRWQRFGLSGAKLIFGGEAMAVRADGRANPRQLILTEANRQDIAELRKLLIQTHESRYGTSEDLLVGFQLTHSGRFCRPEDPKRWQPRVAYRHPLLDSRFQVTEDNQVFTDEEIEILIADYVKAARLAQEIGADFVDLKHCHGYLLHEFLGAHTRPGRFGGSFENRTRILRDIVAGIRRDGNPIGLAVRLSAFDLVPFRPDPNHSAPGKPGPGIPESYATCLPYRYGFGINVDHPTRPDLTESHRFLALCGELGIRLVNLSAGSPYYNPHIQRPASFPPSDGYLPPEDPLVGVARQIHAVRELKAQAPAGMTLIGTGYSYLQEYLPHVAQATVRLGWTDMIGLGRMTLSYPDMLADATLNGVLTPKLICRTFSDCTTAPRNGLISGCYPLDKYYAQKPENEQLKALKKQPRPQ
jgi:NADPH2 dehydrogenase